MMLSNEMLELQNEIEGYARDFGLTYPPVHFEMLDYQMINQVAAYDGFPARYPHWRFGMEYERLSKSYAYGLHRIYEMVINTDPCYAYLLASNMPIDQKLVMAHVYGHADFFKNNLWFAHTNRKMLDEMANHAGRVRRHMERHGQEPVENFIDACLSLDNLIDIQAAGIRRRPVIEQASDEEIPIVHKMRARDYMDAFINPPEFLAAQQRLLQAEAEQQKKFPAEPERDVLLFLLEHAPLENWQRDVLDIVREEAYYFAPQAQTKIMNEGWACATGDSLLVTEKGILPFAEVYANRQRIQVDSGPNAAPHRISDFHKERAVPTLQITTQRGLMLEGAYKHRVQRADGSWAFLSDLQIGDSLKMARGGNLWPTEPVQLDFQGSEISPSARDVAILAGVSETTVHRFLEGRRTESDEQISLALKRLNYRSANMGRVLNTRQLMRIPKYLDQDLAYILGAFVGDGHRTKSGIAVTTGAQSHAEYLAQLMAHTLGLRAGVRWDPAEKGGRWRVEVHSRECLRFLAEIGIDLAALAPAKKFPPVVLRSPRAIQIAFLRGYFDADAYAGPDGIILSSASRELIRVSQIVLLNLGILSRQRAQADGCQHLEVKGYSALLFQQHVGFQRHEKQTALAAYINEHQWFKREDEADTVVSIVQGQADVYDITVEESHCYVANGFVNHNSYCHTQIMTTRALHPSEVIDYADHHSGTTAMQPGHINPYKIGLELYRDVEDRWNRGAFGAEYEACQDAQTRREWNTHAGLGRAQVFQVRQIYNDVGFIDEFLTEEFCRRHLLFTYEYNPVMQEYEIASREFQAIKQRLLFQLTNFGRPIIDLIDANYENRGELFLLHRHNDAPLDIPYAQETLKYLYTLWTRPVHLQAALPEGGDILLTHGPDGGSKKTI